MSGSLKEIRRKIVDLQGIKKITFAMKLVAASKLKNSRNKAEGATQYKEVFQEILARVYSKGLVDPLLEGYSPNEDFEDALHVMLIISSDKGLCGGYNAFLFRTVGKFVQASKKQFLFCPVGQKGMEFCKNSGWSVEDRFLSFSKVEEFYAADKIAMQLRKEFLRGAIGSVTVAYNHFGSTLNQTPILQQILPIPVKSSLSTFEEKTDSLLVEPLTKEMLSDLTWDFLVHEIFYAFVHAQASENAARMVAMDNATNNVVQMLDKTVLQRNRIRQASITAEINEIVAGSESVQS